LPQLLLFACIALAGCAREPQEVSLEQLYRQQSDYDGRDIVTSGVLYTHATPRHYWIADEADHRVELLSKDDLATRVGQGIRVWGRFHYAPDSGRRIDVRRLIMLTAPEQK
jgi:hypothetical protein